MKRGGKENGEWNGEDGQGGMGQEQGQKGRSELQSGCQMVVEW